MARVAHEISSVTEARIVDAIYGFAVSRSIGTPSQTHWHDSGTCNVLITRPSLRQCTAQIISIGPPLGLSRHEQNLLRQIYS